MSVVRLVSLAAKAVAASGTEVQVSTTDIQFVVKLIISAPAANTGTIYLGDADVSVTRGIPILKGTSYEVDAPSGNYLDVKNMWVDAATNGDSFAIAYLKRVVS